MYIVSWEEEGLLFGGEKEKKFHDEDEAYSFYEEMKKKQGGINGFLADLTMGVKDKISNVRIRRV